MTRPLHKQGQGPAPLKKVNIDIAVLRSRFSYNAETGKLYRTNGKEVGYIGNRGYVRVRYARQHWLAHVLIWALVYGEISSLTIDHINRNPSDNRLSNLRLVSFSENLKNRGFEGRRVKGKDLPTGVYFSRNEGKFKAEFYRGGRRVHLGTFKSLEEAAAARASFAKSEG